jgi:nucleotide-binding universal stress UspA family protein
MQKILLPTDGSECALRAVELTIADLGRYRDRDEFEVHLVNVQLPFSTDISRFVSHEQLSSYHREESEKTQQQACALLAAAGIKYVCHHEVGNPAETIARLADALPCERIVMGTNGRGALKEFLVGSVTLKVIQLAHVPILLVK